MTKQEIKKELLSIIELQKTHISKIKNKDAELIGRDGSMKFIDVRIIYMAIDSMLTEVNKKIGNIINDIDNDNKFEINQYR